jgi:membrane-bound ClpP family serine protease
MSYIDHKLIHTLLFMIYFALGREVITSHNRMKLIIFHLVGIVTMISGMTIMDRFGISFFNSGYPLWLNLKLIIWLLIATNATLCFFKVIKKARLAHAIHLALSVMMLILSFYKYD